MENFRVFAKRYFVVRRYRALLAGVLIPLSIYLIVTSSENYLMTSEASRRERSVKSAETQVGSNAKRLADHPLKNHHFRRRSTTTSNDSQGNGDSEESTTKASFPVEGLHPLFVNPGSPYNDVREETHDGLREETHEEVKEEAHDDVREEAHDDVKEEAHDDVKEEAYNDVRKEEGKAEETKEEKGHVENFKFDSIEEEKSRPLEPTSWENYTLCDGQTLLQNGAFCLEENHVFINGNEIWDGKLCRSLEEIFGWSSILEVSAGLGHYGRCFYRISHNVIHVDNLAEEEYLESNYKSEMDAAGLRNKSRVIKSWEGYDGSQNVGLLSGGFVKEMDATQPFNLKQMYDWVLSLGVGEPLPKESLDTFLDNLAKHACKGIVLSRSTHVPDSGVVTSDLVKGMRSRGLLRDLGSQDVLRDSARLLHLKDSVMVFRLPHEKQC
ncbi:uncharacterized protein [Palaemon carinicauda]|uniref:uncharacterized protein n=1 Tax=Palaemon carinicauda TaxID=392227 RepID=UPI0035B5EACA